MLTAIVIGFALQAFLLALAWRSWTLDGNDDVEDDIEDRRLAAERRRHIRMDEAARRAERERLAQRRRRPDAAGSGATRRERRETAMNRLAPLPTVLPLARRAAIALLVRSLRCPVQRAISVIALDGALGVSVALLVDADRDGPARRPHRRLVAGRSASAT